MMFSFPISGFSSNPKNPRERDLKVRGGISKTQALSLSLPWFVTMAGWISMPKVLGVDGDVGSLYGVSSSR